LAPEFIGSFGGWHVPRSYDVVICGAGITGVAAAYYLNQAGADNILVLDEGPPLSLTSDRSTECYRNWWPDSAMLALMNRSIDLMEGLADKSGNVFQLNRRGYLYVTSDLGKIASLLERAERISKTGAGELRLHRAPESSYRPASAEGYRAEPAGADLLLNSSLIRHHYPCLAPDAAAALHVRRAGWMSAQQLGMFLLNCSRERGVQYETGRIIGADVENGRMTRVELSGGENIGCSTFVNAAGPFLGETARFLAVDLPVRTELHFKAAIRDELGVIPRDAPLLIWDDSQILPWDGADRELLAGDPETRWLTQVLPSGAHVRPEGGEDSKQILLLWEYRSRIMEPRWPLPLDPQFAEIALRGLAAMLPGLRQYFGKIPRPVVDGGYYTKTPENRPLIGPLEVGGAYVIGAVSGFGIMSACAAAELLAAHITGAVLPDYAPEFEPVRYSKPDYLRQAEDWGETGQL